MKTYTLLLRLVFCFLQIVLLNASSGVRDRMNASGINEERRKEGCYTNLRENLFDEDADIENPDFVEEEPEEEAPEAEEPEPAPMTAPVAAPAPAPVVIAKPEPAPTPAPEAEPAPEAAPVPAPAGLLGIETPTDSLDAAIPPTSTNPTESEITQALGNPAIINILNSEEDDDDNEKLIAALLAAGIGAAGAGLLAKKLIDDRKAKKLAGKIPQAPADAEEQAKILKDKNKTLPSKQFTADDLQQQKEKLKPLNEEQKTALQTAEEKRTATMKAQYLEDQEAKKTKIPAAPENKMKIKSKPASTTPVSLNDEIAKKAKTFNAAGGTIEEKIAANKASQSTPKLTPLQEKMKAMQEKQAQRKTSIDDDLAAAKAKKAADAKPKLTPLQEAAEKMRTRTAENPLYKEKEYQGPTKAQVDRDTLRDPATVEPKSYTKSRGAPVPDNTPPIKPQRTPR
jgi:hypothetical protein